MQDTRDLCHDHRPTRAQSFVNGVFELGGELKLGPVVPYVIAAIATDKNVSLAGGLSFRFGGP